MLRANRGWRPAFDDLEREEAEQGQARKLQIEPQILRDLRDGADAIELRSELRFRHGQPKTLHALEAVARVGRDGGRIVIRTAAQVPEIG